VQARLVIQEPLLGSGGGGPNGDYDHIGGHRKGDSCKGDQAKIRGKTHKTEKI